MNEILEQIKNLILSQKEVAIVSHVNPDGDTLGSQMALANAVNQFGIEAVLLNVDEVSAKYSFLKGFEQIKQYTSDMILPEVIIFVDCATLERTGFETYVDNLKGKTLISIDHHPSNSNFGDLNYVKSTAAANCQVIYDLLIAMGAEITEPIATALYLGLSTDSGSFLFDSVTADTHRLAAILIDANAQTDIIRLQMYESYSAAKFSLQKHLYQKTEISSNSLFAWSSLNHRLLTELKADSADIDGLINSIKNIQGVEVAILFRGIDENTVKVSLRSKMWADVNVIANIFGGGGHVRAAGCVVKGTMQEVEKQVLDAVGCYLVEKGA